MEIISLTFMVVSLLAVFTVDAVQKRRRFLEGSNHE
jgi:hypothetical protein